MDPNTIKHLAEGVGALGLTLMGAGAVAMIAALGPVGWLVLGIGALGAACLAFPTLGKTLMAIPTALNSAVDGIIGGINGLIDYLLAIPGKIGSMMFGGGSKGPSTSTDDLGRIIPQSFHPGNAQPKPQPVSLSLSVDGRTLAQAISEQLSDLMNFPTGAPAGDGFSSWQDGHNQKTTT